MSRRMNTIKTIVHAVSSWSFAPLLARGAALVAATTVLAQIGQGALTRLDTVSVQPAYAASSHTNAPATPATAELTQHGHGEANAPPTRPPACHDTPGCSGTRAPGVTADGRIILNTASVDELVALPGVGKRRAAAIVALRKRLGRFRRVRDLLRVRGIGFRSLRKITPLVVVDPPKPNKPNPKSKSPGRS